MKTSLLTDLLHFIYPNTCAACEKKLWQQENILCLNCETDLPQTKFWLDTDNPVAQKFWGKVPITNASSFLTFKKGLRVQKLIHNLKYNGRQDIGLKIGQLFGRRLAESPLYADIDLLIPIPLHQEKLLLRGYNQSDLIAQGMAETMGKEWRADLLVRTYYTESQTHKSRVERWLNTKSVFAVNKTDYISGKHILLVDDVITTGSTIEGCAIPLLAIDGVRLSVASIALAAH